MRVVVVLVSAGAALASTVAVANDVREVNAKAIVAPASAKPSRRVVATTMFCSARAMQVACLEIPFRGLLPGTP